MARFLDSGVAGVQRIDRLIEAVTGIAIFSPLADPKIIEIAAALPWELRHGPEGGRILLRRAMSGLLPEKIRLRRTKCHFDVFFRRYFADSLKSSEFREGGACLQFLLNRAWEILLLEAQREVPYGRLSPIFRVGLIGAWLREQGFRG
jgi:hypothetical protein